MQLNSEVDVKIAELGLDKKVGSRLRQVCYYTITGKLWEEFII